MTKFWSSCSRAMVIYSVPYQVHEVRAWCLVERMSRFGSLKGDKPNADSATGTDVEDITTGHTL